MTKQRILYFVLIWLVACAPALAQHGEGSPETAPAGEEFEPTEFILDHIADSHEWHILTTPAGKHVSVYLPVILYSKYSGFHVFSSRRFAHGNTFKGFYVAADGDYKGRIAETLKPHSTDPETSHSETGHTEEPGTGVHPSQPAAVEYLPLDFSVTKNVAAMLVAVIICLSLFLSLANSYRRTGISEPRGIQGFLEPVILFVKEDIVIPNVGEHH
ncbi:MAG: hypothetical protein IH591_18330, partial [Bacteroidales bacterium]|nr:hypothetical protein [Bacteroidales bacterium]